MTQNKTPWRAGNRHILEDASLAPDPEGDDALPHPLAIAQVSWINSSNRLAVWKRAAARWNARAEP